MTELDESVVRQKTQELIQTVLENPGHLISLSGDYWVLYVRLERFGTLYHSLNILKGTEQELTPVGFITGKFMESAVAPRRLSLDPLNISSLIGDHNIELVDTNLTIDSEFLNINNSSPHRIPLSHLFYSSSQPNVLSVNVGYRREGWGSMLIQLAAQVAAKEECYYISMKGHDDSVRHSMRRKSRYAEALDTDGIRGERFETWFSLKEGQLPTGFIMKIVERMISEGKLK